MNDRDEMASAPTGKPASIVSSPSGPTSAKNADSDKRVASQISAPHTQPPSIPDYELLRRIGGGSYGEVWLARSATGVLRAVKIVWRHTFEDDRPFQREFEGIQSFERLSREHPSQLALFHVGRGEGYFFYVMELADAVPNPNDECRNPNEARSPNDKTAIAPGDLRASDFGLPSSFDIRHSSLYSPRTL